MEIPKKCLTDNSRYFKQMIFKEALKKVIETLAKMESKGTSKSKFKGDPKGNLKETLKNDTSFGILNGSLVGESPVSDWGNQGEGGEEKSTAFRN